MGGNVISIENMVFPTAQEAGRKARRTLLPVSDMVHEMLFEHEAPLFDYIQQRRFKGPCIDLHPAVKHLDGLQPAHVLMELLVGVDLLSELMQEGRILWDAVLGVGFHLLGCEHAPVQQKLAQSLLAVLRVEVGILAEGAPIVAAEGHHGLHPPQQLAPQARQLSHGLQVHLGEQEGSGWVTLAFHRGLQVWWEGRGRCLQSQYLIVGRAILRRKPGHQGRDAKDAGDEALHQVVEAALHARLQ